MKVWRNSLGLLAGMLFASALLAAADPRTELASEVSRIILRLNREAQADSAEPALLSGMLQREYGLSASDLKWAVDHSVAWGDIAALAYIRATTGRTFEAMVNADARRDFESYAENAGMNPQKMAHSLEAFLKTTEKERNSRIFERLRASRAIQTMPDLGSGF